MLPQAQPEQPLSTPRRALDIEDYIDILRRHRSWILGPVFLGLVAGVVTAFLWPNSYIASGLVRIVPPQVPTRMVQTNVAENMQNRIDSILQNVLQRNSLVNLIQTHNLYPDERKRIPMEDVLEIMRKDIALGSIEYMSRGAGGGRQNMNAFAVRYTYSDRRLAQKVCLAIITQFINESTSSRSAQSEMTTQFFKDQYEVVRRDLDEINAKIAAYRSRNLGELPEQEQMVMSRITAMEAQLNSASGSLSRAHQDKLQLESQLRDTRDQIATLSQPVPETVLSGGASGPSAAVLRVREIDRDIERTEAALTSLRQQYKDSHPDVQRAITYLEGKRRERDAAAREAEGARSDSPTKSTRMVQNPANMAKVRELQSSLQKLQLSLQFKDTEISDLEKQISETRGKLRSTQSRLEASPSTSQEYLQLTRDRDLLTSRYDELSKKVQESTMSSDLESRKQSETLEVLETPAIPEEPASPKRPLIVGMGIIVGIGLGISLAGAREIKDSSLKNLKDVRAYTKLTVLGSIPLLENDFIVRRRRRLGWLAWAATFLLGILLMAGAIVYYYTSKA